ncbi:hypothetical protein [Aeromonas veronii]|uniref:hypothetical protein n=1 Tax=Aeromonas veronii TaxID=654 RepID=UPI0024853B75|nr:hypothetical protein [Aeromonas veronii]
MTQKVLTKIFESLLNTAAQAPTDDIVNRDGISLMKQGFELIMQAHREGGASGPTSPKELIDDFLGVGMPQKPVTLTTLSEQLSRIEGKLNPVYVGVESVPAQLNVSQEDRDRLSHFLLEAARDNSCALHIHP